MKKKILICEDDKMVLQITTFLLENEGYEVKSVEDGALAVEEVMTNKYDLIISDILMPKLSGLHVVSKIKESEFNKETPTIIVSNLGSEDSVTKSFEEGASDYIRKPYSPKELVLRVKRLLTK
jgi:DNA-binding response OmpR family regulator